MTSYHDEIAAHAKRLRDTLAAVAEHLDGWTVETPHDHGARLVGPDGVRIWARAITYGASNGRVQLTAGAPDGANYSAGDYGRDKAPEITVSPDRDPSTLARDITRRIIPAAVDYWTAVSGRMAARLSAANGRETLARELAEIMGVTAREWRDDWTASLPDALSRVPGRSTYGEMKPEYGGDTVHVEFRGLSADRARELARMVARWAR